MSTGYIDDVGILAWGKTTEQTCETLSRILEKAQRWASTHASVFALDKFQKVLERLCLESDLKIVGK
jgi:hypothetical protein